jgi:hypothetical protein
LDTGSGKTALCYTLGCTFASQGLKTLIINSSDELTFRDFKQAEKTFASHQLSVNFVDESFVLEDFLDGLSYLSYKNFTRII